MNIGSAKVALAVGEKTDAGIRIVSYHDARHLRVPEGGWTIYFSK